MISSENPPALISDVTLFEFSDSVDPAPLRFQESLYSKHILVTLCCICTFTYVYEQDRNASESECVIFLLVLLYFWASAISADFRVKEAFSQLSLLNYSFFHALSLSI